MVYFKQSTNLTAMEPTRTSVEGRWILVTTNKAYIIQGQKQIKFQLISSINYTISADQLTITQSEANSHISFLHLCICSITSNDNYQHFKMITSPPNQYKRPVTIVFNSNNNNSTYATPTTQKHKLQTDTLIITNRTKECNSYLPLSNIQTPLTWKDNVSNMMTQVKENIMNQVQKILSEQMKEAIKEMKSQLTWMVI